MERTEDRIAWQADGRTVELGVTRCGEGPPLLLLPALSSISTRAEMRPLQDRLAQHFATVAVDWPGFGDLPRPRLAWRPGVYRAFLRFVLAELAPHPAGTIAAGHAAAYALAHAAEEPGSLGRLCLLSPTWRGPLPTMADRRLALFDLLTRGVDLPVAGSALYRLNVNGPVIGLMARGHVYADPKWLTPARMAEKRRVTEAPGARHASFRFVSGALDPFADRAGFLAAARAAGPGLVVAFGRDAPPKSKAEMVALGALDTVEAIELPRGKLSFYEEFPDETAAALLERLHEKWRALQDSNL